MTKRSVLQRFTILCAAFFVSLAAFGDPVWVSDQFEVMLRTGPSTDNAIELMIGSGSELEFLEEDPVSGYSRVVTGGGTEGWVLSRYLMDEPAAREQLVTLTQQLNVANAEGTSMGSRLGDIRTEYEAAQRQISALEQDKVDMQVELDKIRRTAANVLAIDEQNMNLQQRLTDVEMTISILEQENESLGSQTTRNWFITGALVLLGGVLLGLILPRMRWSKRSGYDRF
jgi:SH3 domain protein